MFLVKVHCITILITLHTLHMLDLFPHPRCKGRAKVVAKLDIEIVEAFIRNPVSSYLGLSVLFQHFNGRSKGFRHRNKGTIFVPAGSN